ncbi:DUF6193 family natural product biosynthesis protein [Streptomyces sp. NPDC085529]|uniref:DUF6193 family natural product biosynthesis protein n=1 Tax=Streptomyces sp. NPDC085529 TaxID=3365729 RepID=UPI0037D4457D
MKGDAAGKDAVEAGWQAVRDDGGVRLELWEAAYAEPRLRQLFPWTGMGELHFSRCAEQRWTWHIPSIRPVGDGTFRVSGPLRGETVSCRFSTGRHRRGGSAPAGALRSCLPGRARGTRSPRGNNECRHEG